MSHLVSLAPHSVLVRPGLPICSHQHPCRTLYLASLCLSHPAPCAFRRACPVEPGPRLNCLSRQPVCHTRPAIFVRSVSHQLWSSKAMPCIRMILDQQLYHLCFITHIPHLSAMPPQTLFIHPKEVDRIRAQSKSVQLSLQTTEGTKRLTQSAHVLRSAAIHADLMADFSLSSPQSSDVDVTPNPPLALSPPSPRPGRPGANDTIRPPHEHAPSW